MFDVAPPVLCMRSLARFMSAEESIENWAWACKYGAVLAPRFRTQLFDEYEAAAAAAGLPLAELKWDRATGGIRSGWRDAG